ncbi:MAG: hypothetical protein IPG56_12865 [Caulobacteraceae bacterium]|nr:hypothetical protein [Caulobacteraceae bacterium]
MGAVGQAPFPDHPERRGRWPAARPAGLYAPGDGAPEAALGTKLQWIAADHHDTANPHTHLIIRGRRANGQDLVIPKAFIKYGFSGIARDVATEWLGPRSPPTNAARSIAK